MANMKKNSYTAEELDFLTEMMNIGSGNAGTLFSQLLQCDVEMNIPKIYFVTAEGDALSIFTDRARRFSHVKMGVVGDIRGNISFIVNEDQSAQLISLAKKTMLGTDEYKDDRDFGQAVFSEVGNMLANVFLTAVNQFCGLSIFHTVPSFRVLDAAALLKGIFGQSKDTIIILIENEFVIEKEMIKSYIFLNTYGDYVHKLMDSVKEAKKKYGDTGVK